MIRQRLFNEALRLGREIARELGVSTFQEAMTAARILYRGLKIDFRGDRQGDIVIRRCSFSRHYSPGVCRLMSALDAGILSGLAGGGELEFAQRLTEGADCCRAHFSFPKAP
ncbi:MAG: L-2-amino-thiazoline-4-carboxylic acid hydrolase [Candidatus Aminicenantes bacterium]|nr:L-2-amino-thiazoline-4-carboxylic acid hydrolase [Candidatus Aminicenantes bacterium]